MGGEGEMWSKVKEENAKAKQRNIDAFTPLLKSWGAVQVDWNKFRIGDYDIYPARGRILNRPKNKWGNFKGSIELYKVIFQNK